jgi:hypothetical protein
MLEACRIELQALKNHRAALAISWSLDHGRRIALRSVKLPHRCP